MRKTAGLGLAFAATVALATPAHAVIVQWDGTGADDTIDWGQLGTSFTTIVSPTNVTSNGSLNATVTDSSGDMGRLDQGNGWAGTFAPGDELLWNQGEGIITITFASPVLAAGAQIQSDTYGDFIARITASDGSFFDIAGVSSGAGDNSSPFLGVISDSANITSISFSLLTNGTSLAIGQVGLIAGAAPVPEPSTWMMMLIGFGAVGYSIRRARPKLTTQTA